VAWLAPLVASMKMQVSKWLTVFSTGVWEHIADLSRTAAYMQRVNPVLTLV